MAKVRAAQILGEIAEKAQDYETMMSVFQADVAEWGDLFKVRPPKRAERTFSNPRQTEFLRAASAVGTLSYRMMTSADPFFLAQPIDGNVDYDKLETLMHVWKMQLKYANYRANLLRACLFAPTFGTVICQEDYREIGVSAFGRKIPVTVMLPRSLDQVMFDRATLNINEAEWLATADVTGTSDLQRLVYETKELGAPWNAKALQAASDDKEDHNTINYWVLRRLQRFGYAQDAAMRKKKELLMYYGKLECMNDGIEYVCAVVNRKFLVRFHPNNFQHGRRPFRVAKWVDFDQALGYGLGSLLAHSHRQMDANRQKVQDLGSFAAYNMWKRRKNTVADEDMSIRPLQVIDVDNMDDLAPVSPNLAGAENLLKLDEVLKQEFRAAANASDALQAIVTDVTATASSLAQNEAMRAVSVKAEMMADPLVREHLENLHWNNVQNIRQPFNINKAGFSRTVYPTDLRIDLDIEAKVTTDKDFQPSRINKLMEMLQILTSTKSQHPDQLDISILPIVKELAYMLEVKPSEVVRPASGGLPGGAGIGAGDLLRLGQSMVPGAGGAPGGMAPSETPAGPTLTA